MTRIDPTRPYCPNGHPWSDENIYVHQRSGAKLCRLCRVNSMRRQRGKPLVEATAPVPRLAARVTGAAWPAQFATLKPFEHRA